MYDYWSPVCNTNTGLMVSRISTNFLYMYTFINYSLLFWHGNVGYEFKYVVAIIHV